MRLSRTTKVRTLIAALFWAWTSASAGPSEATFADLDRLMARIAAAAGTSVRYREEKVLSFLDRPLVSHGTLRFEGSNRLIREIDGSKGTRYILSASSLVIEEAGKEPKEIRLDDYPAVRALMETMRAVFAGDLAVLKRLYRIGLQSEGDDWALDLAPREEGMSRFLSKIEISGQGGRIRTIATLETGGGDRILMTILPDGS